MCSEAHASLYLMPKKEECSWLAYDPGGVHRLNGGVIMFLTFKKWTAIYILSLVGLFACFALILWQGSAVNASKQQALAEGPVLVIDAGHGGPDGGTVSQDGTTEAQINLPIALRMESLANLLGVETAMTRREDVSIYSPDASTVREKKVSDLKNRAELASKIPGSVLISIHQNSLPGFPSVHGAQAFYNGQEGAELWGSLMQEALNTTINDRPKAPRKSGTDIYLMDRAECPAVLVECGFLSNPEETKALKDPATQTKLAVILMSGTMEYLFPTQAPAA